MPLLPLMQYIFDTSWPVSGAAVFMTATKVWGPLSISLLAWLVFAPWWVALIGLLFTIVMLWADPKFYQSTKWREVRNNE